MKIMENKKQLPIQYANKLLDCEIRYKLTHIPSQQLVLCLMGLYRIGLEHFKSIQSYKHLYFQLKINELLISTNNMIADKFGNITDLNKQAQWKQKDNLEYTDYNKIDAVHKLGKTDEGYANKVRNKLNQKRKNQLIQCTKQGTARQTIKRMISESKIQHLANHEKVKKELAVQDQTFSKKLEQRLQKKSSMKQLSHKFLTMNLNATQQTKIEKQHIPIETQTQGTQNIQILINQGESIKQ